MRWWGWAGLSAATAAVFALSGLSGLLPSLAAAVFLVALPGVALAQRTVQATELRAHRTAAYASSAIGLTVMALCAWGAWPEAARGTGDWLAWRGSALGLIAATALLTAGGLALCYGFRAVRSRRGWEETEAARAILPATSAERNLFSILSLTAGICEEIVYRGFLPLFLMPWFGGRYTLAVLPVTAVFGILHAYQGAHGMVRTAGIGLILAIGVGWTGSLLPSILAHAALNLLIGLLLADSLLGGTERDRKGP